jgi:hypothetical protein
MMEQFIMMNPGVSIDTAVLQASAFGCRAVLARRSVMSLVELGRIVEKGTFLWPPNYSESFKVQLGDSPTQDSAPIVDEPEPEADTKSTLEQEPESASNTEGADDQTQDQEKDAVPTETNTNFRPIEANTVLAHDPKVEIYHEAHLLVRRIAALPANDRAIIHTIVARMEQ